MPTRDSDPNSMFSAVARNAIDATAMNGGGESPSPTPPGDPTAMFDGDGGDAMLRTLMDKYGLTLKQAAAYANKLENGGKITGGREIQGEAVKSVADAEQKRLSRINYYADVSRRYYTGKPVTDAELNYLSAVHDHQHAIARQQAQAALDGTGTTLTPGAVRELPPDNGIAGRSSVVNNEPDARTMDPAIREPARMENMTQWGQQSTADPELNKNWNFDGFTMTRKPDQTYADAAAKLAGQASKGTAPQISPEHGSAVAQLISATGDDVIKKLDPATKARLAELLGSPSKGTR